MEKAVGLEAEAPREVSLSSIIIGNKKEEEQEEDVWKRKSCPSTSLFGLA